jgi:uncharacterized protein with PIN domain
MIKFLCDHMLSRLGKWLRVAGHDTEIILTSISDREVLNRALATHRQLITRDRHFLEMKAAIPLLIYLKANDFDACMQELNQKMKINWLYAPFTRCLTCNSLLEKADSPERLQQIPLHISQKKNEFWYCPFCHHFFWEGSHTERMLHQLQQWQENNSI